MPKQVVIGKYKKITSELKKTIESEKNITAYEFAKKNVKKLIEMGLKNYESIIDLFIKTKMENVKTKELGAEKSAEIIRRNVHDQTMTGWFREDDKAYKQKLVDEIFFEKETLNAGLNVFYNNYVVHTEDKISFDDFLNKDITVYRGGGGALRNEPFTSFTLDKKVADKFGNVKEFTIKPKNTLGSYQTTVETEVLVPKQFYDKIIPY